MFINYLHPFMKLDVDSIGRAKINTSFVRKLDVEMFKSFREKHPVRQGFNVT